MAEVKETYNSIEADKAQNEYCKRNGYPHFAPSRNCYRCHKNIYSKDGGISVESAGKHLITGCPYCNYSYCD